MFMCMLCNKNFKQESHLVRHISFHCNKEETNKKKYKCNLCLINVSRKDILMRHKKICQNKKNYQCDICFINVSRKDALKRHKKLCKNKEQKNVSDCIFEIEVFNEIELSNNFELFRYYKWY